MSTAESKVAPLLVSGRNLDRVIGFVFSRKGFTRDAEKQLQQKGVAYTDNEMWLGV